MEAVLDQPAPDLSRGREAPRHYTAEVELLLCLARSNLGAREAARLEAALQVPIAWDEFIRLAHRHRLLPLCARHLNRFPPPGLPAAEMKEMREYSEQNVRRSLLLTGELRALLRQFADCRIAAVAYKGPVLAQELYGSVALRDMVDLDIVVCKQDALRARDLLIRRGYRPSFPTGGRWDAALLRSDTNFALVQDSTGYVVELHWTPEACLHERTLAEFRQRVQYVSLAGMDVATFARQDLLLLLCLHGCRHMWERLEWVAGVAELLRCGGISWDEVLSLATAVGGRRAVFLGVLLAHDLLDAPVPEDVLCMARQSPHAERLVEAAGRQLFGEPGALAHQLGADFHSFQLYSKDRLRDRLHYIRRRAVAPSSDAWEEWHLPWPLFRLYCAARRLPLVGTYAAWWWRRSTAGAQAPATGRRKDSTLMRGLFPLLLALACGPMPAAAQSQPAQGQSAQSQPVSASDPAGAEVLGPGDVVRVTVWRKPEISGEFVITANGSLAHPFYMDVAVAGVPLQLATHRIRTYVARFESDPRVLVQPLFRVAVSGEVRQPNLYSLSPSTSVEQAVLMAGGVTERARANRILLVRDDRQIEVDLTRHADGLGGTTVRSGDQIVVPRRTSILREYVLPVSSLVAASFSIVNVLLHAR